MSRATPCRVISKSTTPGLGAATRDPGSRQLNGRKAALVLVAVERRGSRTGRVRMAVISDSRAATYKAFLTAHVPGATLYTDGLTSFGAEAIAGYRHVQKTQPSRSALRAGILSVVPPAYRAIGNFQAVVDRHAPWGQPRATAGLPG